MTRLLTVAFLLLVGFAQHKTVAQEPPEECTNGISVGASPSKLTCKGKPKFSLGSPDAAVQSGLYDSTDDNVFILTLNPPLKFTHAIPCPEKMDPTTLNCAEVWIALASTGAGTDGVHAKVGSAGGIGQVNWQCSAGTKLFSYFFSIATVTDDADSAISSAGATFLETLLATPNTASTTDVGNLDVMKLQKFAEVNVTTAEIYYSKENNEGTIVNHFIFKSLETTIKLSSGRYGTIKNSHTITGQTGSAECPNAYELEFGRSSAVAVGKSVLLLVALWANEKLFHL